MRELGPDMTKAQLEKQARATVEKVTDDPQGRFELRRQFYQKYGDAWDKRLAGLGNSELAFLQWEIDRGVLGGKAHTAGSAWWKAINLDLCYDAELAALAWENGAEALKWPRPVRAWLEFLAQPTADRWYTAHNTSIVHGYLEHEVHARGEEPRERAFLNMVLYRVLYAQALVTDVSGWGILGTILANPALPTVEFLTHLPAFYPLDYPLTDADWANLQGRNDSPDDFGVIVLDDGLILPCLAQLYAWAADWNHVPRLALLAHEGAPCYPDLPDLEAKPQGPKQRIAILGGGIAALTAAWELTSYPNWREQYEITVYQMGWRLGGKMAGGRGPNGRVQELGLHLLLGFYVNAFPMFEDVYRERTTRKLAPDSPFRALQDAIQPNNGTLLVNWNAQHGRWDNWPLIFPPSEGYPGDGPPLDTWQLLERGVGILLETLLGSPYGKRWHPVAHWILTHFFPKDGDLPNPVPPPSPPPKRKFDALAAALHEIMAEVMQRGENVALDMLQELGLDVAALQSREPAFFVAMAKLLQRWAGQLELDLVDADDEEVRQFGHFLLLADFGAALLTGLLEDVYDPTTGQFLYRRVNDQDFRAWLAKHGAKDATLYSPMVTFFYTGTFEALADEEQTGGLLAAGTALQFALPAIGYKGSFCYQLRLGTADTLIMPLYQVLHARGVKFEFFHKVTDLQADGGNITRVQMERQVRLKKPRKTYAPETWVKHTPAWPIEPLWEQLDPAQAAELQARGVDLESPWTDWHGEPLELQQGRDFDQVILGIPAKALELAAPSLIAARPDWQAMVQRIHTAQVQSVQLWFDKDMAELGYDNQAWGMADNDCAANVVTYANPMFSWLDQSGIIQNEDWPGTPPKTLLMFTGILPDELGEPDYTDLQFPARMVERVRTLNWQWLMDNMGWFLKAATPKAYPTGIDLRLLRAVTDTTQGRVKYSEQFFAAAVSPSDRYVIAVPGTEQFRLKPDGSGYANLWLVGDWTDYGVNIGYMEGCVVSAHQAVRALRGSLGRKAARRMWADQLADWYAKTQP
jgi:uncharacterized protein with NAD-binding domain and iron-sulfur cluster